MSHDDARGVISVKNGVFDISWNKLGCESNFFEVNRTMGKMTAGLEGMFVRNPMWVTSQNRSVISGHPLGGCSMGESGEDGVVNHAGQVFDGIHLMISFFFFVLSKKIIQLKQVQTRNRKKINKLEPGLIGTRRYNSENLRLAVLPESSSYDE